MEQKGKVYLVGAGPGDAGLITVRGVECIQLADAIVYDNLVNPSLLKHARPDAEIIFAGKTSKKHTLTQDEINAVLVEKAGAGKVVARLKGGDPFVFGRGGEEAEAILRAGLEFEIVPGISSAVAAPAYAGIPVTHREMASAFMVITGHEDPTKEAGRASCPAETTMDRRDACPTGDGLEARATVDWKQVAEFQGTRVILMGVERIGRIATELMAQGASPETPVAMVRWGTTGKQQTIQGTLATISDVATTADFKPPAVTVIGEVARLREKLNWFERRPLFGKRIVVTRSREQASELVRRLSDLGADVLEIPTIRIKPPQKLAPLREAIASLGEYDWLAFTSPNGVDAFFREFFARHKDIREIGPLRIAAVGAVTTQKLADLHLEVDLQPAEFTTEALLAEFKKSVSCENLRFLMPRADLADERLARGLEALGGIVDDLEAYQTVPETEDRNGQRARLLEEGADLVTFTSSSTVTNFCNLVDVPALRARFPQLRFVSIGPQTSLAAREKALEVAAEANIHTIPGLVDAIVNLAVGKA
ncbi:MAG TPA: uroporphyrinogen-III C-methyltransferase [Verrucomicrobiae bacterium]|nr:uroporphyrinogen-III C-methyltransferase [Verrucomicrobiae bacterium]